MLAELARIEKNIDANADDEVAARELDQTGRDIAYFANTYGAGDIEKCLEVAKKVGDVDASLRQDLAAVCKKLEEFKRQFPEA